MKRRQSARRPDSSLGQVGEDELLRRIFTRLTRNARVISGAGDDCALVRFSFREDLLVLKTDCIVENVHFRSDAKPVDVGWKAMARPLSDFAAVSALPQFALVTMMAPARTKVSWTLEVYRGMAKAARAFDVAIVGGETSRIEGPVAISVSITGMVEKRRWVSRHGGKAGDELFVTGTLGGSIRGKHLHFVPRISQARWLTEHFRIHAMMDLSDGLGVDLPRLAAASGVGFKLKREDLPRTRGCTVEQAISDGEDYELLFAIPRREAPRLTTAWRRQFPKIPLTRVGSLNRKSSPQDESVQSAEKIQNRKFLGGYVHFKEP